MPDDGYVNPDNKPYSGRYKWVPPTIPSASDTAISGWLDLRHERGSFRNDYFINTSYSTNYTLLPSHSSGTGVSYYGSPEWPINRAFRRKQNPTPIVPPVPNKNFWVKSNSYWWQANFDTIATNLSAITFEYSLLVDINDPNLLTILNQVSVYGSLSDYESLKAYQSGESSSVNIDWTKYIFGKIKLYQSTDTEDTAKSFPPSTLNVSTTTNDRTTYTSSVNWNEEDILQVFRALPEQDFIPVSPDEYTTDYLTNTIKFNSQQPLNTLVNITIHTTPILATGYFNGDSDSNLNTNTITVHFDYGSNDFKDISKLRIQAYYTDGPLIKFSLKKVMLFKVLSNPRVNINNTQLPCRILAYAFNINCNKIIPGLSDYYPNDNNNPTFYVKMFHPEDIIKSRGFAHAIDLRFFVPSFPIYTFNGFSLAGGINEDNNWVVFVGPTLSKKNVIYYFTPQTISSSIAGRLIRVNDINLNANSSIYIQTVKSDSKPSETADWKNINLIENSSSPNFSSDYVNPWLFHDKSGTSKSWYRIIQVDLNTSVSSSSDAIKGQIYTEKSTLKLETTGVSNIDIDYIRRSVSLLEDNDPLNLEPLAFFTVENIEDLLGSNILFRKGQWKFTIKAKSNDIFEQTNTHLFLRMWFHPGEDEVNYNLPHQYRNSATEIIFEEYNTDPTNISDPKPSVRLKIGTPSSLSNLIVTPPLTQEFNTFEILRYADGLIKNSGTNNLYSSVFTSPTTKLVIGIYTYSNLVNATSEQDLIFQPPTVEIELDPISSKLETCLLQNSSGTLSASRYYAFQRTNYIHFNTDNSNSLKLTRNLYEGGLAGIGNSYISYDNKFTQINSDTNPSGDSRVGLITFESGVGNFTNPDTLICIEHKNYSLYNDKSVYYFADFTTKGSYFQDGRVNTSSWNISFRLNKNLDTLRLPSDYKIQAFFVDRYGKITERVFTSPFLKPTLGAGDIAILNYSATITQPFFITGTDAHLIVRLISYPRSSNSLELTESEINTIQASLNGEKIGTRIKNFYLTINSDTPGSSGLTKLNIVDAGGFTGSTRFYEDLDLVPSTALDSQQFWFYASAETLKAQIIQTGKDFIIMGALYSPTWFVKLPKDIEVSVIGGTAFNSVFPYALKIRTVLDDKATTTEDMIKAFEENTSLHAHVVCNGVAENDSDQTQVINYININDPYYNLGFSGLISGLNQNQRNVLAGEDPIIFGFSSGAFTGSDDIIGLLTENQSVDGSLSNISINTDSGALNTWMGPNYNYYDNSYGSNIRQVSKKITKFDAKLNEIDGLLYIVGIINPGALILRIVDIYKTMSQSDQSPGLNFIVDGPTDINSTLDFDDDVKISEYLSGAALIDTRPSIIITNQELIFMAYVLEGSSNKIYCKIFTTGGDEITQAFPIIDMSIANVASHELAVYCPVLTYDKNLNLIYCTFWCAGKIFISILTFNEVYDNYIIGPIYLVAGNRDLDSEDNPANSILKTLVDSNILVISQYGDLENDLHRQSVGVYVSNIETHMSELFIYYKTSEENNSDVYVRKFDSSFDVTERIKIL